MGRRLVIIVVVKKSRFLACVRNFRKGETLTTDFATLKPNEGYFLGFNVAIIRRSIGQGVGNFPMVSPIFALIAMALRGGDIKNRRGAILGSAV